MTAYHKSNIMEMSNRSSLGWGPRRINWMYIPDTRPLMQMMAVDLPFGLATRARVEFVTVIIPDSINLQFNAPLYGTVYFKE